MGEPRAGEELREISSAHYRAAPAGAYVGLRHALAFCTGPALSGFAIWGAPEAAELAQLAALAVATPAVLVDLRGLERGELAAFAPVLHQLTAHAPRRLTVVRPDGVLGMAITGFFHVVRVPYAVEVFAERADAVAACGAPAALAALLARARAPEPLVAQLRAWLADHVADATLAVAARAHGRSRRSLQRDLHRAGSSFRAELQGARIDQAKRLLRHTPLPLTRIAHDIGCASLQHFSILFRAHTGETPSSWRAHHR
jgi:AraC-like DNA-binding protein